MDQENRVVVLIDMDCFYCQVEEKLDPELKGKPIAVVQYNPWKGGGIIAVNYVARAMGVTRHMRGDEAKEKCPEIQLPSVPCFRGKADISKYREAGKEVAKVLQTFTPLLERASIDEAYMDITDVVETRLKSLPVSSITPSSIPNTFALGYNCIDDFISDVQTSCAESIDFDGDHATRLLVGALVVTEIRDKVYQDTGYRCSAGVAHNKILAKLVCGMNKPNKQTLLPKHCVNILYKTLPLKKVKHLGGKFGESVCDLLKITHMGDLQRFTEKELQAKFDEKNGTWLYKISRGVDSEPVQSRLHPKSVGCCKQFRGRSALKDQLNVARWLQDLADEIQARLEKDALENSRTPRQMVVSFASQLREGRDVSSSRSYNFTADDDIGAELFAAKALELVLDSTEGGKCTDDEENKILKAPISFLGISVGKFEDDSKKTKKILDYFAAGPANVPKTKQNKENELNEDKVSNINKKEGKDYILKKFFQVTDKNQGNKVATKTDDKDQNAFLKLDNTNNERKASEIVLNTNLDEQESFFAKLLNKDTNRTEYSRPSSALSTEDSLSLKNLRPTTPQCKVIDHGEDSNGTEYSGSTINAEIDKSIALFDEDPDDVVRVSAMREMLNKSAMVSDNSDESGIIREHDEITIGGENNRVVDVSNQQNKQLESNKGDIERKYTESNTSNKKEKVNRHENQDILVPSHQNIDSFECPECNKIVPMRMIDEHADYHLALNLREEERQHARKENKERIEQKAAKKDPKKKIDVSGSISSFLVKVDGTLPTECCAECGKKVPKNKLAEHLDFHEAQKLNRELNKRTAPSYFTGSGVKKRKTVSPVKKTKIISNSKSIDSFFK